VRVPDREERQVPKQSRRLFAAASAIAVMAALGTGVTGPNVVRADKPSDNVTLTSQPAVSNVLTHYTVTPAMRGGTGSASGSAIGTASDDQLPDLSPKGDRR
jgi:H+/gluconate symporter-like permease